jgi:hypothetical protein
MNATVGEVMCRISLLRAVDSSIGPERVVEVGKRRLGEFVRKPDEVKTKRDIFFSTAQKSRCDES